MFSFPPRSFRTRKAPGSRDRSHPWGVCQSRPSFVNFLLLPVCKNHWTDQTVRSRLVLACSAGIFFGYAHFICSRKCHVETPKERKKWGESKSGGGEGREKRKRLTFSPLPLSLFLLSLFRSSSYPRVAISTLPQSSSVIHESKMAFQRWRNQETPWCQSLILEKWMNFEKKQFFFLIFCSSFVLFVLIFVRKGYIVFSISLYITQPEIQKWPDIKFFAHTQYLLR